MHTEQKFGLFALRALATIRLVNGLLGLLAPQILIRRLGTDPDLDSSAFYPFRMFGVRTVVLGADLLSLRGQPLRRATATAVLIHSVDTASAIIGGLRGDVPAKVARLTTAISGVNTALSLAAWYSTAAEG